MPLTPAQLPALKAAILADTDPAVIAALGGGEVGRNDTELARLYNLPTTFICWRKSVSQDEIMQNGFDWVRVDNLSIGKARIWEWLFDNPNRVINPSKANVRLGIDECWKGTAPDLAVRAAVYLHCKRAAKKTEKLFATGTGTDADPGLLVFEGDVTINDIGTAMNGA